MVRVHAGQPPKRPLVSSGYANYFVGLGLDNGNANVAETDGVGDVDPAGDAGGVTDGAGDGVGVGLGGGGIIFSQ